MGVDYHTCGICCEALSEYSFSQCKGCYELVTKNVIQYECKKCKHKEYDEELCCKSCEKGDFNFEVKYYENEKKYKSAIIKLCFSCQNRVKKHINSKGKNDKNNDESFAGFLISDYEERKKIKLEEWNDTDIEEDEENNDENK